MNRRDYLIILMLIFSPGCSDRQTEESVRNAGRITGLLAEKAGDDYRKADEPRELIFPEDHGAHPEFRIEWWYFSGNLISERGWEVGYQFTLFRNAVRPEPPDVASEWAANQLYMAHFALSDIDAEAFYRQERFSRGALELAGVKTEPFRAWLEDWTVAGRPCTGKDCFAVEIGADAGEFGLRLVLNNTRPPVLHGDRGLSVKSPRPGNASYYYSYPRLRTQGEVALGGERFRVQGESWFDHEWSSSMLEENQTGWDWFSLQLSDNTELMIYQIRNRDADAYVYSGSYIQGDRDTETLADGDFVICVLDSWRSDHTGIVYPSGWKLSLPSKDLVLEILPRMAAQEMTGSLRYWEGAVGITGTKSGRPVGGRGYAELTGYAATGTIDNKCNE